MAWIGVKSRSHFLRKHGNGTRVSLPWPAEALPKGGELTSSREGVLVLGGDVPRVQLDSGGSVELPAKDFYYFYYDE